VQQIWREGGARGFFRGNATNLLRSCPESAIMFYLFDQTRQWLGKAESVQLTLRERFLAGAFAGTTAQAIMYPLNTARVHLAVSTTAYRGLFDCLRKIVSTQGVRGLYLGNLLSTVGNLPYYAIELGTFSFLKESLISYYAQRPAAADGTLSTCPTVAILGSSMLASFCALLSTYPVWTVRTQMQTQHILATTHTLGTPPAGAWACARDIYQRAGGRGLYRGLTPSLVRLLPAQSLTYTLFTKISELI
jgi:solute carrier family 25 phosphate transporter 23/24/25/41